LRFVDIRSTQGCVKHATCWPGRSVALPISNLPDASSDEIGWLFLVGKQPLNLEEKASGAKRDRPELSRLFEHLRAGDVVTVTRLDRLARSTRDLLDIAERIKETVAGLRSLAEP
jgi:hypothetical protein